MDDIIASYTETTPHGRRTFHLHKEQIVVDGLWDGMKYETTVMLESVRPLPDKLWYRDPAFRQGIWWLLASVFLFLVPTTVRFQDAILKWFVAFGIGALVGGVWICFRFRSRNEYARFVSTAGILLLDIGKAGLERDKFDGFIEQIVQQVRATSPK